MSTLRLITFDVNNTLIRVKNMIGLEYKSVSKIYGIDVNPNISDSHKLISDTFRNVWTDMNKNCANFGANDGMSSQQWWSRVVKQTIQSSNCFNSNDITEQRLNAISSHLYKLYSTDQCWTVDQYSHRVLSQLKQTHPHIMIGVISNFDERLDTILTQLSLRHYFEFVLMSAVVRHAKPDPQIFDMALNAAKLSDTRMALHIGDNINLDYLPAKSYGWNAILINDIKQFSSEQISSVDTNDVFNGLNHILKHPIFN